MRYRLRTLLIAVAVLAYLAGVLLVILFARPMAETASDYVMELGARAVFRGVCYATFEKNPAYVPLQTSHATDRLGGCPADAGGGLVARH